MLVAVTDHAAQRFRQRVRGTLEAKTEIASRVARAHAPGELVVVTVWEEGNDPAVPKRFTDALRRDDHLD